MTSRNAHPSTSAGYAEGGKRRADKRGGFQLPATVARPAPAGGGAMDGEKSGARSREAWLRSVHGDAERIGECAPCSGAASLSLDALEVCLRYWREGRRLAARHRRELRRRFR